MREAGQDRHPPGVGFHRRRGLATEQNDGSPAGPADALDHLVVRSGRDGAGGVVFCLPGVGAHAGATSKYRQRLGPDLVQAELSGEPDRGPRVASQVSSSQRQVKPAANWRSRIATVLSAPICSAARRASDNRSTPA